jgi:hypothetical protein
MIDISSEQQRILLENGTVKNWQITVYDNNGHPEFTIPTDKMVDNSLSIKESICSAQTLDVGACESSVLTIKLANLSSSELKDKKLMVTLNASQGNTSVELDMGTFYVDDVPHENNTWFYTLTAYDSMILFDVKIYDWYNSLTFPMTLLQFRTALCAHVGVETAQEQRLPLDDMVLTKCDAVDINLTGRQALRAICEINGAFGHINRQGQLVYIRLGNTSVITLTEGGADHYKSGATHENWTVPEFEAAIAYSLSNEQGIVYPAQGGFNAYMLGDNFLCYDLNDANLARVAQTIYDAFEGITYVGHNTPITGRPWLEVGDVITIDSDGEQIDTYIFERTLAGFQCLTDKLSAKAVDTRDEDKSSTHQQIERLKRDANEIKTSYLKADIAEITYATIENLEATNAVVSHLEAIDVEITGTLTAVQADIQSLHADKADVTDLTAAVAHITYLEGDVAAFHSTYTSDLTAVNANISTLQAATANISTLVAQKASITDLQAATARIGSVEANVADIDTLMFGSATGTSIQTSFANAVIAQLGNAQIQSAMIDSVSASKISAGNIFTNAVRIYGDNSHKLSIVDNTISISDGTNVRVQIGEDAEEDYNIYIWDGNGNLMFDALGLTTNGITRKVIRNDVVMDNANISAYKLDIDSLFSAINEDGSNTLSGSKIKLDTQNQTLDIAFTNLTSLVNTQGSTISSQGTAISTIQGQISSKIWQQDITAASDALSQTMNTQYSTLTQNINSVSVALGSEISSIQQQIDGATNTFVGDEAPTLQNYPAAEWAANGELQKHIGSMYYDSNGYSYRFMSQNVFTTGGVVLTDDGDMLSNFYWMLIRDSEVSRALQDAAAALQGVNDIEHALVTSYSTTAQMHSYVDVAIDSITQEVSETYATHAEVTAQGSATYADAVTYADGVGTAAAADATSKANAAETAAKNYYDVKIADYSTTTDVRSMIQQTANSITQTITDTRTELISYADGVQDSAAADATSKAQAAEAAAIAAAAIDATSKANSAEAAAISTAAADATSKANAAVTAANGYTDNLLTSYSTTAQMQSAIQQTQSSILQTVSATYTTKAEYEAFEVGARNLILNSIDLVGKTHYFYAYGLVDESTALTTGGKWLVI